MTGPWEELTEAEKTQELRRLLTAGHVKAFSRLYRAAVKYRAAEKSNHPLRFDIDLQEVSLAGLNLRPRLFLPFADLTRADLRGVNLFCADLRGCDFKGADLTRATLAGANARGANFSGANLTKANLAVADLVWANFSHANMRDASAQWANMKGSRFVRADLDGTDFNSANLSMADLTGAQFEGAFLAEAKMDRLTLGLTVRSDEEIKDSRRVWTRSDD